MELVSDNFWYKRCHKLCWKSFTNLPNVGKESFCRNRKEKIQKSLKMVRSFLIIYFHRKEYIKWIIIFFLLEKINSYSARVLTVKHWITWESIWIIFVFGFFTASIKSMSIQFNSIHFVSILEIFVRVRPYRRRKRWCFRIASILATTSATTIIRCRLPSTSPNQGISSTRYI